MKGAFITGGALSFKGDKKAKKKKSKSKHKSASKSEDPAVAAAKVSEPMEEMTEAERKAAVRKKERERKDLEKLAQKSHRETIEGESPERPK